MSNFKNVNVEKIANIYFDGKVISRNISFNDGSIKTLGVMLPGEYKFNTSSKEIMDIISGNLSCYSRPEIGNHILIGAGDLECDERIFVYPDN